MLGQSLLHPPPLFPPLPVEPPVVPPPKRVADDEDFSALRAQVGSMSTILEKVLGKLDSISDRLGGMPAPEVSGFAMLRSPLCLPLLPAAKTKRVKSVDVAGYEGQGCSRGYRQGYLDSHSRPRECLLACTNTSQVPGW